MEFVKLGISSTKRYYYKDASSIEMNVLGDFLVTDVGYRYLPFEAWALDNDSQRANGTLTALEKEENSILLTDIYPKNNKSAVLRMTHEQFIQMLTDWQQKVCVLQPQSVVINYDGNEFDIETNNEVGTEAQTKDNITLFPLIPHKYPFWIKLCFITCCAFFMKCLLEFPYYQKLSVQVKKAHHAFENKDYAEAANCFGILCAKLPDNKYMKRYFAQSLFKSDDFEDHMTALKILSDIELKRKEWQEMLNYMPAEYTECFQTKLKFR